MAFLPASLRLCGRGREAEHIDLSSIPVADFPGKLCYNSFMSDPDPKSIFDIELDEAEEARLDAEAEADIKAGRVVPHEKVAEWLDSWGTDNELPCPVSGKS